MINNLFTFYHLLIVNLSFALSYLLAKNVLKLPFIRTHLTQQQQLKFARGSLLLTTIIFLIMPSFIAFFAIEQANFEWVPTLKMDAIPMLPGNMPKETTIVSTAASYSFSFSTFILFFWLISILISSIPFIRSIFSLHKLRQEALCIHRLKNITLLFSHQAKSPFCWSFINNHFIIVPYSLLENKNDCRVALRHEFQHIRQGDTYWLQCLSIVKLFCFWNPFLTLWMRWLSELQEFSCDETLILSKKVSASDYAQCLINTAKESVTSHLIANRVLAIGGLSKSLLYRRVNMLFSYKKQKPLFTIVLAYLMSCFVIISSAYALNGLSNDPLTANEVTQIITQSDKQNIFHVTATPEVVTEINRYRSNLNAKETKLAALKRMTHYQPYIENELKKNNMPIELLTIPLVESGYKPLPENVNPVRAAGIWQIIPSTAKNYGLILNENRDDRMNLERSTKAALNLLKDNYARFHDWKLAVIAYEIGEKETERLIKATGSRDAWKIAHSQHVPAKYKESFLKFLATFDASVIIFRNPSLLTH